MKIWIPDRDKYGELNLYDYDDNEIAESFIRSHPRCSLTDDNKLMASDFNEWAKILNKQQNLIDTAIEAGMYDEVTALFKYDTMCEYAMGRG
jgi:hypothetical protein